MAGRYPLATLLSPWSRSSKPANKMKSSSSIFLEATENRRWERHSTVAFYGARLTSNLLGIL
jgi:hypothetical protein